MYPDFCNKNKPNKTQEKKKNLRWSGVYMPHQHTNNINKGLYMQSQIHCLHNVEQTNNDQIIF